MCVDKLPGVTPAGPWHKLNLKVKTAGSEAAGQRLGALMELALLGNAGRKQWEGVAWPSTKHKKQCARRKKGVGKAHHGKKVVAVACYCFCCCCCSVVRRGGLENEPSPDIGVVVHCGVRRVSLSATQRVHVATRQTNVSFSFPNRQGNWWAIVSTLFFLFFLSLRWLVLSILTVAPAQRESIRPADTQ